MSRAQLTSTVEQNTGGAVSPYVAGKNKIINGDFGIWQRGTSFTPTSAATIYSADRFTNYNNGSGVLTISRQTFTPGSAPVAGYEGQYFLRGATAASLGTTTQWSFGQNIEDVRTFAGQTVTVSFWARQGTAQGNTIGQLALSQNFGSGGSTTVTTSFTSPGLTTSWARYSVAVAAPSVSGQTIGTSSFLSLSFTFNALASQTIDIWGVQLEAGSVATPFTTATATFSGELAACQRYLPAYVGIVNQVLGVSANTANTRVTVPFPVTARVAPTGITVSSLSHFGLTNPTLSSGTPTAIGFVYAGTSNCVIGVDVTAGSPTIAAGTTVQFSSNNASALLLFTGCEL